LSDPLDFDPRQTQISLFDALIKASKTFGASKPILEDQERTPLAYTGLIRASFALGGKIASFTAKSERVGILLPSSSGMVVTFFALHSIGRVPTMLNFTAGLRNLKAACKLAGIKTVLTSHRFIEQGKLHDIIDVLDDLTKVVYLEDVRAKVGAVDKVRALAAGFLPQNFRTETAPDDPGVILFTSGSFGAPKGVVLTQANLVANAMQVAAHIPLDPDWVMFNPLPTFHCFGLTGGVLLPILNGLKAFQYPSPLHTKQIPPLMKDARATILLATDTFVNQYARAAAPEDFSTLKFVVCGAERVRDETHDNRRGTVGGLLPGIEIRLEPVEGIELGGRLLVKGPNVMAGYLADDGSLEPLVDGWHDTGDVVTLTDDNWITIRGRVKRFAKIGGEMVSMTAAEDLASAVWPDGRHAVISMPDPRKGERLVLVTDCMEASPSALVAHAQSIGAPELAVPRKIVRVTEIPILGSGKTDYVAIQRMAETDSKAA